MVFSEPVDACEHHHYLSESKYPKLDLMDSDLDPNLDTLSFYFCF